MKKTLVASLILPFFFACANATEGQPYNNNSESSSSTNSSEEHLFYEHFEVTVTYGGQTIKHFFEMDGSGKGKIDNEIPFKWEIWDNYVIWFNLYGNVKWQDEVDTSKKRQSSALYYKDGKLYLKPEHARNGRYGIRVKPLKGKYWEYD